MTNENNGLPDECADCGGPIIDYKRYLQCRECGASWKRQAVEYEYRRMNDE